MDKTKDSSQTEKKTKKSTNPLYVVTNKGKDIEEAEGQIDAWIKKLGLEPVIEFLEMILVMISEQVKNYSLFIMMKEYVDLIVGKLEELMKLVDPVFLSFFPESINLFGGLISFDLPKKK